MMYRRSLSLFVLVLFLTALLAAGGGCERNEASRSAEASDDEARDEQKKAVEPPSSVEGPMTPRTGGEFAPSLVRRAENASDTDVLMQEERCAECHSEIVQQWRDSMHRWASFNNPMYRLAFDDFVDANGHEKGKFCAGCHDPVPLFQGKIGEEIPADLKSAYAGVTCNTCHGIKHATNDGNASYTLTTSEIPVPRDDEPGSLKAHKERVAMPALDSDAVCTSCHRGFLSPATGHDVFILGFDELGPWRRSGWGGSKVTRIDEPVPEKRCVDCHMPKHEETGLRSHRFAGGHTTGAKMVESEKQLEAIRDLIDGAATIDVAAAGNEGERFPDAPDEFAVESGGRFWVDVVARNVGGGHNLPGGQRDLRDTWFEVVVEDATGAVVAEAGRDHHETGKDESAHRLRALLLTSEAETEKSHRVAHFRTKAYDHTIPPRNAELVRYGWDVPTSFARERFPLTVKVRLIHRRLSKSFHSETCEASKTDRGQAFLKGAETYNGTEPKPCVEQPVTVMATDSAKVHRDRFVPGDNKPSWKRWFDRGLALQSQLSERLAEAIDSFDRSIDALEASGLDEEAREHRKAMALVGQAQVMSRQRRHRKAIETFDRAESYVPKHPSIFVGRGDAYAKVWLFEKAIEEYRQAAELADDDRVWRKLAIGLGSLEKPKEAIVAAQKGLAIEPRDPDLLRSQMLALRDLDVPQEWVKAAVRVYDTYKRDEEAHILKAECSERSEICELERLPIHTHELESP